MRDRLRAVAQRELENTVADQLPAGAGEHLLALGAVQQREGAVEVLVRGPAVAELGMGEAARPQRPGCIALELQAGTVVRDGQRVLRHVVRSEEHTSELQSLMRISYAVFCLKKKNQYKHILTCNT